jgi:hypothetical protein
MVVNKLKKYDMLENRTTLKWEEMEQVRKDLVDLDHNTIFCSYIRQPIHATKKDNHYQIDGICALTHDKCYRSIDKSTEFKVEYCIEYKKYFEGDKNGKM